MSPSLKVFFSGGLLQGLGFRVNTEGSKDPNNRGLGPKCSFKLMVFGP